MNSESKSEVPDEGIDDWESDGELIPQPFPDDEEEIQSVAHIRIYQRKSRKFITTVEIHLRKEIKEFISVCCKKFHCGGFYDKRTRLICFTGDVREQLADFLIEEKMVMKDQIRIHGF